MLTVQNDWIEYETEPVPARRVAVRGGAACAQRVPAIAAGGLAPVARPQALRRPAAVRPAVAEAVRPAASTARLRLTRRGRVVLVVLPSLLLVSGALLAAAPGVAEAAQPAASSARSAATVVVAPGDTLWGIAERVAPDTDPRTTVAAIERANGLAGADLQAGDVLVLPSFR